MEIVTLGKIVEHMLKDQKWIETYLIGCNESPQQHKYFLMKWNLGATIWKKRVLAIDEVLEVLNETCVQWVEVYLAMHDSQQSVVFVDGQIF